MNRYSRSFLLLLALCGVTLGVHAAALDPYVTLPLWPDRSAIDVETVKPDTGDGVIRLTDIANPSIQVFLADSNEPTPAVLVCPGGGYSILAFNKEGTEVAEWLNKEGLTAVVLKYSVPNNRAGALADAQRAMGLIRKNAGGWNVNPKQVGVLGFSAGGHLAASVSTHFSERSYEAVDVADSLSCRPDFSVLVYPAYIAKDDYMVGEDILVAEDTPPAFLVQTQDDKHYINSSIAYYIALKDHSVPAELHVFPKGGHGYGLRPSDAAVSKWPSLCAQWFRTMGILP